MKKHNKIYAIQGVNKSDGGLVYYAINNGGIPFWSNGLDRSKLFYDTPPDYYNYTHRYEHLMATVKEVSLVELKIGVVETIPVETGEEYLKKQEKDAIIKQIEALTLKLKSL